MSLAVRPTSTRMSSAAKSWLSQTIRDLRARLLKELDDALESTYRLSIPASRAELDQERAEKRRRLESWLDEQSRAGNRGQKESVAQARLRHRAQAVKLVAATWLNRLVVLGQLEALKLARVPVFTGGIQSKGFVDFRQFAPALGDDGYPMILQLVFDELALDLPGLFGPTGLTGLVPMPWPTLRHLVDTLQADDLPSGERADLWRDDTLLGWVYQFWNDPEREALDEKIRTGGKIENHEIAAKTQLFTDRYMVEWLLQNSLGQLWLEMCAAHGWTARVVAEGTLDRLEARRAAWRARRERGEVDEEALMPLEDELEERWKYYVPRPVQPGPGVPERLADLKLLDPACGSGHFLVIAFDLLLALYEEEAVLRGVPFSVTEAARSIVENNLHGLDIDPRAVQIAAAALWLKVRSLRAEIGHMNLVASNLGLASLPKDDPALLELVEGLEREAALPRELTLRLVDTLKGADHLGSLLKVNEAVDQAVSPLFGDRDTVLRRLEEFVARHSRSEDLGLRLRGEQLASGVRFIRLVREGQYQLVVGNPPYQHVGKSFELGYLGRHYPEGKSDLYAAFLHRGLSLCLSGGLSTFLTLRGWLFLGGFEKLRAALLRHSMTLLGDLDRGAFELVLDEVVATAITQFRRDITQKSSTVAILPTPQRDRSRDARRTARKRASLLAGYDRYDFHPHDLRAIPGQPLIYWWDSDFLARYSESNIVRGIAPGRVGANTGNNTRFLRNPWEINRSRYGRVFGKSGFEQWTPYIKGAAGQVWFEPLRKIVQWRCNGLEIKVNIVSHYTWAGLEWKVPNSSFYCKPGVAFTATGADFNARLHRYPSIFDVKGSSLFPPSTAEFVCLLNSAIARGIMEAFNPTVSFQVGDINRLPLFRIESADDIVATLDRAFTQHEQARETSVEFKKPGPSPWKAAQEWAQQAVDRPAGAPLPLYHPVEEPQGPLDELSYQLGLALGRFDENGVAQQPPQNALTHGILFLSASGGPDSTEHPAALPLQKDATYLRTKFFTEDHLKRYEKRPIYLPLSSEKKNFVAWCSIHRWTDHTLLDLMEVLGREQKSLSAEIADAAAARETGDKESQASAHKRHEELLALLTELQTFLRHVQQIAERGAPPAGSIPREADASFRMDLDDGVMINAAALWPLLQPQWKDPKTWWAELCDAKGKKDYDWSHLAARYFPHRVDKKCQSDPSLAVAHGVFWKYHPEKAYQWELRLQSADELGPDFRLVETGSNEARAQFERDQPDKVRELREAEQRRRARKQGPLEEVDQSEFQFDNEEPDE